jgi:hypothetical protein
VLFNFLHNQVSVVREAEDIVWARTTALIYSRDIAKFFLCHKHRIFSASGIISISNFTHSSDALSARPFDLTHCQQQLKSCTKPG